MLLDKIYSERYEKRHFKKKLKIFIINHLSNLEITQLMKLFQHSMWYNLEHLRGTLGRLRQDDWTKCVNSMGYGKGFPRCSGAAVPHLIFGMVGLDGCVWVHLSGYCVKLCKGIHLDLWIPGGGGGGTKAWVSNLWVISHKVERFLVYKFFLRKKKKPFC